LEILTPSALEEVLARTKEQVCLNTILEMARNINNKTDAVFELRQSRDHLFNTVLMNNAEEAIKLPATG
jgi:hypothetical protein